MTLSDVGQWLKSNGAGLIGLVGALATGGIPAGVAAAASILTEATDETDPGAILKRLQTDPETMVKLRDIAQREEADIRAHHREMVRMDLEDRQEAHRQQQETIRSGDNAEDQYVRHTRPMMARQSWYATALYVLIFELIHAFKPEAAGAQFEIAMVLLSPAAAYIGFRSIFDKPGQGLAGAVRRVVGPIKAPTT